jgi:hypothetical protein
LQVTYIQNLQVLLRSWRLALQEPSMKYGKLNSKRKTNSIFLVDADFLYDKAPGKDVMLQNCD